MLNDAIYNILSNDAPLVAAVGTQIFPVKADAEEANPCIVFEIGGADPRYTKDGAAPVIFWELEVDIFVSGIPDTGWDIAALVKTALDQYTGENSGEDIDLIQWEGTNDGPYDPDQDEYQISMGFRVMVRE